MSGLKLNGRIKVSTFQKDFIKQFPYLVPTLRTTDGKGINNKLTIAGARSKAVGGDYKPSGQAELSVNGNLQVGSFENRFKAAFGIDCEICYKSPGGKLLKTNADRDKTTLTTLNAEMKAAGCQVITL